MNKNKGILLLISFLFLGLFIIKASTTLSSNLRYEMTSDLTRYAVITATNFLIAFLMGLMNWVFARFISKEPLENIGWALSGSPARLFLVGFLLTAVIAGLTISLSIAQFAISFKLGTSLSITAGLITMAAFSGLFQCAGEELWMRSWFLSNFALLIGRKYAVIFTGLIFGLMHFLNPAYSWLGALSAALAGIMFSAGFFKTRTIIIPIGLHYGWNLVMGLFFNRQIFRLSSPLLSNINQFTAAEGTWWGVLLVLAVTLFVTSKYSDGFFSNPFVGKNIHNSPSA